MSRFDIFKPFYRSHYIRYKIEDELYEVEYHRNPFWTYEKRSIRLFLKEKLCGWHGQVWLKYKNGSRCGFETIYVRTLFPKKFMKMFLEQVANSKHRLIGKH